MLKWRQSARYGAFSNTSHYSIERHHIMHMADGFISPAVGCTMWAAAAITTLCARKVRQEKECGPLRSWACWEPSSLPAKRLLNFTIPGTGSSGHLGGGLILAVLLGPYAGFLVMAAILTVQALFFADGGLLALGCKYSRWGFSPAWSLPFHLQAPGRNKNRHGPHQRWPASSPPSSGSRWGLSPSFWKQRPPGYQPCPSPNLLN